MFKRRVHVYPESERVHETVNTRKFVNISRERGTEMKKCCHGDTDRTPYGTCRQCSKIWKRKYLSNPENAERVAANNRKYYHRDVEKSRETGRLQYHKHKEQRKNSQQPQKRWAGYGRKWMLKQYGLTTEAFQEMNVAQQGKCYLCQSPPTAPSKFLHVDHDHTSGKVRRLLCLTCNVMLGAAKDDPKLLRLAAEYLESYHAELPAKEE
jgi:hypothetical protein